MLHRDSFWANNRDGLKGGAAIGLVRSVPVVSSPKTVEKLFVTSITSIDNNATWVKNLIGFNCLRIMDRDRSTDHRPGRADLANLFFARIAVGWNGSAVLWTDFTPYV